MGYPPRIDFPGARHHVMSRGARRQSIFADEEDCTLFLDLVGELPGRFGVVVHGYSLMPNHFHLMVESRRGLLSRAIQHVTARYTRALNRRYDWDGPVLRGRFRSRLVEDPTYWMHLLAYLHLNQVRAGLAPTPDHANWSSHAAYRGLAERQDWLTTSELLEGFGGIAGYVTYVEGLRLGDREPPESFDEGALWPSPAAKTPPVTEVSLMEPDAALARIEQLSGVPRAEFGHPPKGSRGRPERWVAAWWLERATALRHVDIAALLETAPAQVSRWIRRIETAIAADGPDGGLADLARRLEEERS